MMATREPRAQPRRLGARALALLVTVATGGCGGAAPPAPRVRVDTTASRLERQCGEGTAAACAELAGKLALDPAQRDRASEIYARACELGEASSCTIVARALLAGEPEGRSAAATLLDRACELGDAGGCVELAHLHRRGVLVAVDLPRARELTSRACQGAGARGCAELGRMQQRGLGGALEARAAVDSYRRGCQHDDAEACFELGRAVELGRGSERDPAAAYDHYRRAVHVSEAACEAADLDACHLLGLLLREGSGTAADRSRGLALQESACQGGHVRACVAWWTRSGLFVVGDGQEGRVEHLARACAEGEGDACLLAARIAAARAESSSTEPSTTRQLLDRGCELGSAPACNAAALERVPPDERGRAELERACALGDGPGCHSLGWVLELDGDGLDAGPAVEHHRLACQTGLASACTRLGSLRASAVGGAPDPRAAASSWQRGCELGDARACYELGVLLQDGRQVAVEAKVAHGYLQRACRGGEWPACTRLGLRAWRGLDGGQDRGRGQSQVLGACEHREPLACLELAGAARRGEGVAVEAERLAELVVAAGQRAAAACEDAVAVCHDRAPTTSAQPSWTELDGLPARLPRSWPECGIGLERRCGQARELLTERCSDDPAACFRAARLEDTLLTRGLGGRAGERDRLDGDGLRLSTRACTAGDADACRLAAEAQRRGWGTKADPERAGRLEARACKLEPAACAKPQD